MKRWVILLSLILTGITIADTVGYLDSQRILREYNEALTAQAELAQKQKEFQELLLERQSQLKTLKNEGTSQDDLVEKEEQIKSELEPVRDELLRYNEELSSRIENEVLETTKAVAKQLRIDVVLDKQAVLFGGMDITSLVLSKLNQ